MGLLRAGRVRILAVAAIVGLATACLPYFPGGSSLVVQSVPQVSNPPSPDVNLIWSTAFDGDAGDGIWYYAIYVDGQYSAYVYAPATNCTLTGLASGTSYNFIVTAVSLNNEWSGSIGGAYQSIGRLSANFTTPAGVTPAGPISCTNALSGATDTDGDRLPDWAETGDGVFVNLGKTGTSPTNADTDGDGIKDGDETLGTTGGLPLPLLGTSPVKKNILIEADWFDDSVGGCGAHSHRPADSAIDRFKAAFANANVPNPNGTTGIDAIVDYGQGLPFNGGNLIDSTDSDITGGVNGAEMLNLKAANFASNRNGYFHYAVFAHSYNGSGSSGQAELPGDDMIVSMSPCVNWWGTPYQEGVANTIMHELGHNLNLFHGGTSTGANYKPNYNSIMNYAYQFPGVDNNCTPPGDRVLNYSYGTRPSLNEANLNELVGICGSTLYPWDWNGSGTYTTGLAYDINRDPYGVGDGLLQTLTDFNDWGAINLGGISDADGAASPPIIVDEIGPPTS